MNLNPFNSQKPNAIRNGAYFSPGDECLNAIISFIQSAQKSLKVCVFTISDDRISRTLRIAHEKGIQLQLLTDNEKLFDKGSDIKELAEAGLEIRVDNTKNHMHHKFAIADNGHVLTGSYNWTRSAALYNHENILITSEKEVVADYAKEFNRLWAEMEPFI